MAGLAVPLRVAGKVIGVVSVGSPTPRAFIEADVALLQSFTQKETAQISSPAGSRAPVVEPFGSYTVGRVQKDWDKGNTILGGMVTSTHRSVSDPALAFLPTQAWSGGLDFTQPAFEHRRLACVSGARKFGVVLFDLEW